jgi:hypothetical protein
MQTRLRPRKTSRWQSEERAPDGGGVPRNGWTVVCFAGFRVAVARLLARTTEKKILVQSEDGGCSMCRDSAAKSEMSVAIT